MTALLLWLIATDTLSEHEVTCQGTRLVVCDASLSMQSCNKDVHR